MYRAESIENAGFINDASIQDRASTLVSKNVTILGRRTSVRLEPEMWKALDQVAKREGCRIHDICTLIFVRKKQRTSLTAAIRVFLMLYYKCASTEDGHRAAGHGSFRNMAERAKISLDDLASLRKSSVDSSMSQRSI